jgi:hypothetical protein
MHHDAHGRFGHLKCPANTRIVLSLTGYSMYAIVCTQFEETCSLRLCHFRITSHDDRSSIYVEKLTLHALILFGILTKIKDLVPDPYFADLSD